MTGFNFQKKYNIPYSAYFALANSVDTDVALTNSVDPDEMPPYATFHLGHDCLPKTAKYPFWCFWSSKGCACKVIFHAFVVVC